MSHISYRLCDNISKTILRHVYGTDLEVIWLNVLFAHGQGLLGQVPVIMIGLDSWMPRLTPRASQRWSQTHPMRACEGKAAGAASHILITSNFGFNPNTHHEGYDKRQRARSARCNANVVMMD